jgi:hypothetical protein
MKRLSVNSNELLARVVLKDVLKALSVMICRG